MLERRCKTVTSAAAFAVLVVGGTLTDPGSGLAANDNNGAQDEK